VCVVLTEREEVRCGRGDIDSASDHRHTPPFGYLPSVAVHSRIERRTSVMSSLPRALHAKMDDGRNEKRRDTPPEFVLRRLPAMGLLSWRWWPPRRP